MTAQDKEFERITQKMREVPGEDRVMELVRARIGKPRPPRPRLALTLAAAAVVVVVAVVAVSWVRSGKGRRGSDWIPVALLESPAGNGGGTATAFVRGKKTGVRAGATVIARGIARIAVLRPSTIALDNDEAGLGVDLDSGEARFDVDRLQAGYGFSVRTPHAEIRVKGTVFQVAVSADRTDLSVREGRVLWIYKGKAEAVEAGMNVSSVPPAAPPGTGLPAGPKTEPAASEPESPAVAPRETRAALTSPARTNGKEPKPGRPEKPRKEVDGMSGLMAGKKYAEAVAALDLAYAGAASPEEREDFLFMKGQIQLLNLDRFADAAGTFGAYLREFPAGTYVQEALFHVAEAYGRQGDYENAAAWFSRFVVESRDDARRSAARYNVGALALRLKNDCEEALKWFGLALITPPPDIERKAVSGAVGCHVRLGRAEGLKTLVDRLGELAPADPALGPARALLGQ